MTHRTLRMEGHAVLDHMFHMDPPIREKILRPVLV